MIYVMVVDEEKRESMLFLVNSVVNEEALLTWLGYLSLPTGGWDGEGLAVASVAEDDSTAWLDSENNLLRGALDYVIPSANAAGKGFRVGAGKLDDLLRKIQRNKRFNAADDPGELIGALKSVQQGMKGASAKRIRSMVHSHNMLAAAGGLGGRALRQFTIGMKQLRISPVVLLSVIAYIETRRSCPEEGELVGIYYGCQSFPPELSDELNKKYTTLLKGLATAKE